eukprot:GHVL01007321.1.p1 GENE.GHVL01007321.1~~GHVL01007321.1.p1  ORF type:complete len:507 (+),score=66.95 GHVL01007321.1:14-1534(+)
MRLFLIFSYLFFVKGNDFTDIFKQVNAKRNHRYTQCDDPNLEGYPRYSGCVQDKFQKFVMLTFNGYELSSMACSKYLKILNYMSKLEDNMLGHFSLCLKGGCDSDCKNHPYFIVTTRPKGEPLSKMLADGMERDGEFYMYQLCKIVEFVAKVGVRLNSLGLDDLVMDETGWLTVYHYMGATLSTTNGVTDFCMDGTIEDWQSPLVAVECYFGSERINQTDYRKWLNLLTKKNDESLRSSSTDLFAVGLHGRKFYCDMGDDDHFYKRMEQARKSIMKELEDNDRIGTLERYNRQDFLKECYNDGGTENNRNDIMLRLTQPNIEDLPTFTDIFKLFDDKNVAAYHELNRRHNKIGKKPMPKMRRNDFEYDKNIENKPPQRREALISNLRPNVTKRNPLNSNESAPQKDNTARNTPQKDNTARTTPQKDNTARNTPQKDNTAKTNKKERASNTKTPKTEKKENNADKAKDKPNDKSSAMSFKHGTMLSIALILFLIERPIEQLYSWVVI